jgi:LPS-assembly lipoprotein
MSSPDRRQLLFRAATLAAVLPLAGCLRPLYGQRSASSVGGAAVGGDVASQMAAIEIVPVNTRVLQKIRNELSFRFTGGGEPIRPALYRLTLSLSESFPQAVVDPVTGRIEIETVSIDAYYSLAPVGPAAPGKLAAFSGTALGRASLTRSRQRFANVSARRDAEDRAAMVVADQIQTQLAARFALPPK